MSRRTGLILAGTAAIAIGAVARRRGRRSPGEEPARFSGRDSTVVTSDGAELALTSAGTGPTVVFAHGWTESSSIWDVVATELSDTGHHVVVYDQRGHGRSTVGSAGFGIERLGEDLGEVLAAIDASDAVLVGHSMGGMTVMALLAHDSDLVRARTRGSVLVSTAAAGLSRPGRLDDIAGRVVGSEWAGRAFAGRLGPRLTRRSLGRRADPVHAAATAALFAATAASTRQGCYVAMSAMDLRPELGSIQHPVVVVVGAKDHLTPPRFAREIARLIPGSELVVIPDAGHQLPFEAPKRLVSIIRSLAAPSRVVDVRHPGGASSTADPVPAIAP